MVESGLQRSVLTGRMRKLDLGAPAHSDRIIGFTIPRAGAFFVCDHDEVWRVTIAPSPSTEITENAPYDFVKANGDFLGLVMAGETPNTPVMRHGLTEISYDFDPKADFVTVHCRTPRGASDVQFRTMSGDWFAASLSDDGKYLILAEPYDLAAYELP